MVTSKTGQNFKNGKICTEIKRMGEWENGRLGE
jgi:hypothetical protein